MNIFLDDVRNPEEVTWVELPVLPEGESWTIVRSYNQFCDVVKFCMLTDTPVRRVCFDHDLADYSGELGKEKDGSDCAYVLADACCACDWSVPEYVVHSMNSAARNRITAHMEDIEKYRKMISDWNSMQHPWKRVA